MTKRVQMLFAVVKSVSCDTFKTQEKLLFPVALSGMSAGVLAELLQIIRFQGGILISF